MPYDHVVSLPPVSRVARDRVIEARAAERLARAGIVRVRAARLMINKDVVIIPRAIRTTGGAPLRAAEFDLEFTSYTVTEGLTQDIKITRSVRVDQVLDVDWAAVNVSVLPVSGTERFQAGETEKTVQVTAQEVTSNEQGTFELSNPQYVSGPVSNPVLGSNSTAIFFVNNTDLGVADIIVQDNGSDSTGDGSGSNPYFTLEKALSFCTGGEIIEVRKAGGGTWTYNDNVVINESFSENNEVTIRVRENDRFNIYPTAVGSYAVLHLTGASYIKIDGTSGEIYVGDRSWWSGTNGGTDSYPYNASFRAENAHHWDIQNVHFSGADGYEAMEIANTCHHYRFLGGSGYGHGYVRNIPDTSRGDGMGATGNNCIIENFQFGAPFGGHNGALFACNSQVIRNCDFDVDWQAYTDLEPRAGDRAFAVSSEVTGNQYDDTPPFGPTVMEDCRILNCGNELDLNEATNANYKLARRRTIFRFNYVFRNRGYQVGVVNEPLPDPHGLQNSCEFISQYHNTFDRNDNIDHHPAGRYDFNLFTNQNGQKDLNANNIYSNIHQAPHQLWYPDAYVISRRNVNRWDLEGYPDYWKGARYFGNMFNADGYSIHINNYTAGGADLTVSGFANWNIQWPDVFDDSNFQGIPTYVDELAETKAGYALSPGSAGEDAATPMATVQQSITGTQITLDYAYWIYDGFDLAYFGEVGDQIAIYNSDGVSNERIVRVTSVDSETQVTVESSVTVAANDKVFAVHDGVVCKNIGAAQ